jgi:hypothetical protein
MTLLQQLFKKKKSITFSVYENLENGLIILQPKGQLLDIEDDFIEQDEITLKIDETGK